MKSVAEAIEILRDLHDQNGDKNFPHIIDELKFALNDCQSYDKWINGISYRSDLSDDMRWEYECWDATFRCGFALVGK